MSATTGLLAGRVAGLLAVLVLGVHLAGCGLPRGPAVPFELQDQAVVPHLTRAARTWGTELNPEFEAAMLDSVRRERIALGLEDGGPLPPAAYLALSGGGADGAFGAGLLCGWTVAGDRPQFKLVTGISTGALIAPFAFLGPQYDYVLREVYTGIDTGDILKKRGLLRGALFSDALADARPLWRLLERYVNEDLLEQIAQEYEKGRLLVIGTTNLDARRAVLWNIGEIAASDNPDRLDLIRSILVASASIPAAFPPVLIDVEADGERFQEMHVDGGAMTQVFVYPPTVRLRELAMRSGGDRIRRAYIIRNARLDPQWSQVDRRTLTIAERAISSLIQTQGLGDLYRIYISAQRDGVDFNLAYIPSWFSEERREAFDPVYMSKLFQVGFDLAVGGYPWQKTPPFFETDAAEGTAGRTAPAGVNRSGILQTAELSGPSVPGVPRRTRGVARRRCCGDVPGGGRGSGVAFAAGRASRGLEPEFPIRNAAALLSRPDVRGPRDRSRFSASMRAGSGFLQTRGAGCVHARAEHCRFARSRCGSYL